MGRNIKRNEEEFLASDVKRVIDTNCHTDADALGPSRSRCGHNVIA